MKIIITAKTEKGKQALLKLNKVKSFGVARKRLIEGEHLSIEIQPRGVNKITGFLLNNPSIRLAVVTPMIEMMKNYDATENDYTIEVK